MMNAKRVFKMTLSFWLLCGFVGCDASLGKDPTTGALPTAELPKAEAYPTEFPRVGPEKMIDHVAKHRLRDDNEMGDVYAKARAIADAYLEDGDAAAKLKELAGEIDDDLGDL